MQNNCDGSGPHTIGTVKLYPLGSEPLHGNLILCRACWQRENQYRRDMGREYNRPEDWPTIHWQHGKEYNQS